MEITNQDGEAAEEHEVKQSQSKVSFAELPGSDLHVVAKAA